MVMPLLKYSPVIQYGIPQMQRGSKEHDLYWREEIRRCREGYKPPDGVFIPGTYYRHLNHRPLMRRVYPFDPPTTRRKILTYPLYRDLDHEVHQKIHDLRTEGKRIGAVLLKGRRKAASDNITSITEHELLFNVSAECFYCTPDEDAMLKIKQKFALSMNNTNQELAQPFVVKNVDERRVGMEVETATGTKNIGSESILYTSQIPKVSIWKGASFSLGITDEIGTFGKRVKMAAYWGDTVDCFKEGDVLIGFHIFLGTVDQISYTKNTDLENFWRYANEYNMERILIPADVQYGDCWDVSTGQSDRAAARKKIYAIRAKLDRMDDKTAYWKEVQNNPLNEDELFIITINSRVNVTNINEQIKHLSMSPRLMEQVKTGILEWEKKTAENGQRIYTGRVFFIEKAGGLWVKSYEPVNHIYPDADITAVDDYFKDEAQHSDSLGAVVVWRRFINNDEIYNVPVLTYLGRPPKLSDFHDEALKCAVYTKSRAAVEYHNDMFKNHFLRSKNVDGRMYLKIFPRVNGKVVKESDAYGYNIKDQKEQIEAQLNEWSQSPHLQNCLDIRFLRNIAVFGKQNSDLGSAAGVALNCVADMAAIPVKGSDAQKEQYKSVLNMSYQIRPDGIPVQMFSAQRGGNIFRKMKWLTPKFV